ncbi:uncharacterized protein [Macrobrachium rosenbergii]|uniref:uncharacterized protein n=1 Tax=Macrobrachium rosenbergii TaxID=79674 RepID=UPI0034D6695F
MVTNNCSRASGSRPQARTRKKKKLGISKHRIRTVRPRSGTWQLTIALGGCEWQQNGNNSLSGPHRLRHGLLCWAVATTVPVLQITSLLLEYSLSLLEMARRITTLSGMMLLLLSMSTILSSVYGNSFQCPGEGSFSKPGSCSEYYTCVLFIDDKLYSRLEVCPGAEIFDDAERKCVLNSHLSSPHACLQGSHSEEDSPVSEDSTEDHGKNLEVFSPENPTENLKRINTEKSTGISFSPISLQQSIDTAGNETDDGSTSDETTKDATPQQLSETTKDVVPQQLGEITKDVVPQQLNETTEDVVPQQPNVAVNANVQILSLCDLKNITDAYFMLAIGSPALRRSSGNQKVYNKNVMHYNRDIRQAHSNTYLWRRKNSIPQGLRQSHQKANEYKNDFQKKFAIYKEQIQLILSQKTSSDFIQRLEGEIRSHVEHIRRAQENLNSTLIPEIRQILEQTIDDNRKEIERKQLLQNPKSEVFLLRELVTFVTLVRDDASEVEGLARQVLQKMDNLLEKISTDAYNYAKLDDQANEGIKNLTEEATGIREELRRNAKYQEELVIDRKTVGEKLGDLRIRSSKIDEDIRAITKNITGFIKIKDILCIPSRMVKAFTGLNVTCSDVLKSFNISFDLQAENARLEELHRERDMILANQSIALEELNSSTPKRMELSGETLPKTRRLELIEFELYNMQFYVTHLQKLEKGVAAATDSILQLQRESQGLQANFESRVIELQDMIDAANTAITGGIVSGTREIIENDLENLLITLQNQKLNNINDCFAI